MNRGRSVLCCLPLVASLLSPGVLAQKNTLELNTTFKGNQEQPKVLYIVPWQSIEAPEAKWRPMQALIDKNFQLLDREEFRRGIRYREVYEPQQGSR